MCGDWRVAFLLQPNAPVQRRAVQRSVRCHRLLGAADNESLARCARFEHHGLLTDLDFAVLEVADALINVQDCASRVQLCVHKPEAAWDRALSEQALTGAENHGKLPDT